MGRTLEQIEEKPRERRRVRDGAMGGFNRRLVMPAGLTNNPNYVYRWVNDEGARLSTMLANDYDFANETGGEVDPRSAERHFVHAGTLKTGKPLLSYLMRKRKEWHDGDKADIQTAIDENMKKIQANAEEDPAKPTGLNVRVS